VCRWTPGSRPEIMCLGWGLNLHLVPGLSPGLSFFLYRGSFPDTCLSWVFGAQVAGNRPLILHRKPLRGPNCVSGVNLIGIPKERPLTRSGIVREANGL
jgi:hypothetical protein